MIWSWWMLLYAFLILLVLGLFVYFVQLSWNYAIPNLAKSVDSTYDPTTRFTDIDYWTALILSFLILFLFTDWVHLDKYMYRRTTGIDWTKPLKQQRGSGNNNNGGI